VLEMISAQEKLFGASCKTSGLHFLTRSHSNFWYSEQLLIFQTDYRYVRCEKDRILEGMSFGTKR
jgi:hypothetical protein